MILPMLTACAIGSAAADVKARMTQPALETTDVPGRITLTAGGAARNVAENLARLGVETTFVGVMGDDALARSILEHSRAAGLHMRPITHPDLPTASLAVTIDSDGRQIAGVFSGEILDTLTLDDLVPYADTIRSADALIVDSGVPESVLGGLAGWIAPKSLLYAGPGSAALAPRLKTLYARCDVLSCNHLEAERLTSYVVRSPEDAAQAAGALVAYGVRRVVVTLGPGGLAYADSRGSQARAARPAHVVDATGAGDALAAAMIFALLRGDDIEAALGLGLAAAAVTCEVETSVRPDMSYALLRQR